MSITLPLRLSLLALAMVVVGCTGSVSKKQSAVGQKLSNTVNDLCEAGHCPCTTPAGPISDGAQITVFDVEHAACSDSCQKHGHTLTCKNGKFDEDITKDFFTCSVDACKSCVIGNTIVSHGANVTLYSSNEADCGQSCESLKSSRLCNNGVLEGDTKYSQTNCLPKSCSCRLPDNSGALSLGGSMPFYSKSKAACGERCADLTQTRTCTSTGTGDARTFSFDGSSTYQYSICEDTDPATCRCKLPNNLGDIANGGTFILSSQASVRCSSCASVSNITVTCQSGVLKNQATGATLALTSSTFNTYKYQCQELACMDCSLPGYGTIGDTKSQTLYIKPMLDCGEAASTFTYNLSCSAGKLYRDGLPYTPPATAPWSTSLGTNCIGCKTPWGVTVAPGTVVTMYQASVSGSASKCVGCKSQQKTCQANFQFDGDTNFNLQQCPNAGICNQEGGGAPPRLCLLPWQNSFVTPGAQIPMWSKRSVACGDSCQNYFKFGKCQLSTGTFDAGLNYIYESCTEDCP